MVESIKELRKICSSKKKQPLYMERIAGELLILKYPTAKLVFSLPAQHKPLPTRPLMQMALVTLFLMWIYRLT